MARIRTIKPEFWDSPGTARASLRARLFFIAMWNWADDWGIGTANPSQLMSFAFPNDEYRLSTDFPSLRTEVAECFDVQWYEVDARPYFAIPSWDKHQKNERRSAKRNPGPDQGKPVDAEMRGISVRTDGKNTLGTGEQGNRGTDKELVHLAAHEFENAYSHWPKKVNRKKAFERFKVKQRTHAVLVADIIRFGDAYAATTDKQFVPGLDVWLNGERWTDELPTAPETKGALPATQPTAAPDWSARAHQHRFDAYGTCIRPGCQARRD